MASHVESREGHPSGYGIKEEDDYIELDVDIKDVAKTELEVHNPEETARSLNGESIRTDHKVCSVCGRSAKNHHFGVLCCDPCGVFFRRGVQSNLWETYICFKDNHCDITKNRKSCQCCRFKKCLSAGMDMSLVMTEADRRARRSRKMKKQRQITLDRQRLGGAAQQSYLDILQEFNNASDLTCDLGDCRCSRHEQQRRTNPVNEDTISKYKIADLQKILRKCLTFPEVLTPLRVGDPDITENLFIVFCKNIGRFFCSIPEFQELDPTYQGYLLKPAIAKAMFILGTHQYNPINKCWPRVPLSPSCMFPTISMSDMERFIDDDVTMRKWKKFIEKFSSFFSDEVVTLLVLVTSLFDYKNSNLMAVPEIALRQAKYLQLYKVYLQSHHYQASNIMANLSYLKNSLIYVDELMESFQNSSTEANKGAARDDGTCQFSHSLSNKIPLQSEPTIISDTEGFSFLPAVTTDAEMILFNS
ncbi:thyroid hormone receptor alpha-like [Macrobrachium nipponense]|uniref:thyroid hormone receptor alpha-like n=1 Tax=Macrobrachium nipponense TaxID=159736 RepID=UPI0030C7F084